MIVKSVDSKNLSMPLFRFLIFSLVFLIFKNDLNAQLDTTNQTANTILRVNDSLKNFTVLDSSTKRKPHIPVSYTHLTLPTKA